MIIIMYRTAVLAHEINEKNPSESLAAFIKAFESGVIVARDGKEFYSIIK